VGKKESPRHKLIGSEEVIAQKTTESDIIEETLEKYEERNE